MSVTCNVCGETKPDDAFYFGSLGQSPNKGFRKICKPCDHKGKRQRHKNAKKAWLIEHGAKCEKCGYDRCTDALDFHHKDPSTKVFNITRVQSVTRLRKELSKCIILCSNCHREIHAAPDRFKT